MAANVFWFKTNDLNKRVSCHAPWYNDNKLYWDCGNPAHDKTGGRLSVDYLPYLDKWTHIALVSAGSGPSPFMAIYINGQLQASSAASESPAALLKGLVIGSGWDSEKNEPKYQHKGQIDQFRVWNQARTQKEIKRDMDAELIGDEPGLVACFNFNWGIADTQVSWLEGIRGKIYPIACPTLRTERCSDSQRPISLKAVC